jgi:hypothetical protein
MRLEVSRKIRKNDGWASAQSPLLKELASCGNLSCVHSQLCIKLMNMEESTKKISNKVQVVQNVLALFCI